MKSNLTRFGILLVVTFLLQLLLPQVWAVFSYADFFILLAFHTARRTPGASALGLGFTAGLVQDATFSHVFPLGIQAFAKMTLAYLTLLLSRRLNLEHPGLQVSAIFLFTVFNILTVAFFFVIFGRLSPIRDFLPILFSSTVNAFLSVPAWALSSGKPRG